MATLIEALTLAVEHHRAGRLAEAEVLYGRILDADPENATALHLLGVLLAGRGEDADAAALIARSIAADGGDANAHYNLATILERLGRVAEAEAGYRGALALAPDHAAAHNNLGLLLRATGRADEAVAAFRAATGHQPGFAEAWFNLGAALANLGRDDEAVTAFDGALAARPGFPAARAQRDRLLAGRERAARVRAALDEGRAKARDGDTAGAVDAIRAAVAAAPEDPLAAMRAAEALALCAPDAALALFRRAVALAPAEAATYLQLGGFLHDAVRVGAAARVVARGLAVDPGHLGLRTEIGRILFGMGRVGESIAELRRAAADPRAGADVHDSLLFAMLADAGVDNGALFAAALASAERLAPPLPQPSPHANPPDPDRRLRIGYLSGAIRDGHNALFFLEPLLRHHDPARVAVFVYGDVDYAAPEQARLRALVQGCGDTTALSDADAAERIRADGIDVLISLLGRGSLHPRTGILAHRPAPVQAAFHHVMTTALPGVDHWLSDRHAHPRDTTERFTERLVRLPRYCQYRPPAEAPPVAPPPVLRTGRATFGCFTSRWKISDPVVALWARILDTVPGSRLLLKGDTYDEAEVADAYRARFARHGVGPDRLDLRPRSPTLTEHLAAYGDVDVALDTFPYSYGNTAFEALWMGVPVVTLPAGRFAGRMTCSILHAASLPEWIAGDADGYVALATALARDPDALARRRAALRGHLRAARLLDGRGYARSVERACRWMWRRWCADRWAGR